MESDLFDLGRWAELPSYIVSVDAPDPKLDSITELAVRVTDADVGGISLLFQSQIWMPSRHGIDACYLPRAGSFCTWAVDGEPGPFEVPDASADPRFSANPLVAGAPHLRHYAGVPLRGAGGHLVGTLWVMGRAARTLDERQFGQLALVADIAADTLTARYCDPVTGMYNRTMFLHHLQCVLERGGRDAGIAVGHLDLAGFRDVNDVHGRAAGDEVLRCAGTRLLAWAGPHGLLGHLGGDRFAFALCGADAAIDARLASLCAALDGLEETVPDGGAGDECPNPPPLRARIGVCRHAAETAAASIGAVRERSVVHVYDSALRSGPRLRYELGEVIRGACLYGALEVHYQPQVDVEAGCLIGLEALVRWRHPSFGLVGPNRFIGQAEASGEIVDLDLFVLDQVCRDLRDWRARGLAPVPVGLNLSRISLLHPTLPARLDAALAAGGLPGSLLEFEVTESLMLDAAEPLQERVAALRALGVRIAVDDFGTGYSNLDVLHKLPFDRLKVDRRFVDGVAGCARTAGLFLLIQGIAALSGAELVCEGLEREDDLDWLRRHGAHRVQGWYFSAARPGSTVAAWLAGTARAPGPAPVEALRALLV
jgi:c-di-GMP phosphodiesterase